MKKIKISVENYVSFVITEEEFIKNDKAATLDKLFSPLINFAGEATFSGPNWYAEIEHEGLPYYTVNLEASVIDAQFTSKVSSDVMQRLYNNIRKDIDRNVK